jgi:hypothetical protein
MAVSTSRPKPTRKIESIPGIGRRNTR